MSKFIEKIIETVLKERCINSDLSQLDGYADYLIFTLQELKNKEIIKIGYLLPGGFSYYSYIEQTINNVKSLYRKKVIPEDLAWQRLEYLAERISEALETFDKTQSWK